MPEDLKFELRTVKLPVYLRVSREGVIQPLQRKYRKASTVIAYINVEYPDYDLEYDIRQKATRFDETSGTHFSDFVIMTEERVRHCLVSWNLHEVLPGLTRKIHRVQGVLDDESMELWKKLPPLVRKEIAGQVNSVVGGL